jgi:hypothetical protein
MYRMKSAAGDDYARQQRPQPAAPPSSTHFSIDASLRQQRASNLSLVKSILQPYYDNSIITRDEFIAISKRTLDWTMSHIGLRQGATWDTVSPLVESQISFLLEARSQHFSASPVAAASSHAHRPHRQDRVESTPGAGFARKGIQEATISSSGGTGSSSRVTSQLSARHGASHVQHLMEKFYLHDDDDEVDVGADMSNMKNHPSAQDVDDDVSSLGIPSTAEGDDFTNTHNNSKRASYVMTPSCSSGPIDPEDPSFQQRQQRLANFQRTRTSLPATVVTAPPAFSLDDIAALLLQHQRQHTEDMQGLLISMEHRHALIADESAARYSVAMDETVERSVVAASVATSINDAAMKGLHRTEWEEAQKREVIGRDALSERCAIADLMQEDVVLMVEAAEERQRELERAQEAADSPPPPPATPRPAQQFFGTEKTENAQETDINVEAASGVLQRLRMLVDNLPHDQRRVVEQRIQQMEAQLQSLKRHAAPPAAEEERVAVGQNREYPVPGHGTPRAITSTSKQKSVDPYAPISRSPVRTTHSVQHSTVTPTRKPSASKSRQIQPFSPGTLRKPLPTPTRAQVVEFIRSMLQPLYDQEALDRDVFVGIVKHLSQTFFHQDGWLRPAERLLGAQLVHDYHVNPSRQPALWKVYLHKEMCEIVGDDDLPM